MIESPYLNAREAARYLRFVNDAGEPNVRSFYKFRRAVGIRAVRRGRSLLFKRVDLDRALDVEQKAS